MSRARASAGAVIPPGGTIGIVGGGQLGRMTALAAARLGYRAHIFCPPGDAPAAHVSDRVTRAEYDDKAALASFADAVDVVTFEFENIPHHLLALLEDHVPVRPRGAVLEICQDRVAEKRFVRSLSIDTAPFAEIAGGDDLAGAAEACGFPAVLKTCRFGYDGKGQRRVASARELSLAWKELGGERCILEGFVDFACEISAVVARGLDGSVAAYDIVENRHIHHILDTTIVPAPVAPEIARRAREIGHEVARNIDLVGLIAVEMFVMTSGAVLVNELAPRPHNSGHWTIDAAETSQFEQLVRAVTGLPLGSPRRFADAEMKNLIGDAADNWPLFVAEPGVRVHLYGKDAARPGRKMGHLTRLRNPSDGASDR